MPPHTPGNPSHTYPKPHYSGLSLYFRRISLYISTCKMQNISTQQNRNSPLYQIAKVRIFCKKKKKNQKISIFNSAQKVIVNNFNILKKLNNETLKQEHSHSSSNIQRHTANFQQSKEKKRKMIIYYNTIFYKSTKRPLLHSGAL